MGLLHLVDGDGYGFTALILVCAPSFLTYLTPVAARHSYGSAEPGSIKPVG